MLPPPSDLPDPAAPPAPPPAPAPTPPNGDPPADPQGDPARPEFLPEAAWKDGQIDIDGLKSHLSTLIAPAADLPASASDYALPEIDGFDREAAANSPIFKALMAGAHANKLGQAQFEGVISEYVKEMTATEQAGFDAEMKKLGDKSDTRLQAVANFLGANLPPEQVAALRAAATSADAIMGLEALMNRNANPQPRNDPPAPVTRKTRDEITALMATSAYSGRPNERNPAIVSEVDKWFEDQAALDAKGTK